MAQGRTFEFLMGPVATRLDPPLQPCTLLCSAPGNAEIATPDTTDPEVAALFDDEGNAGP